MTKQSSPNHVRDIIIGILALAIIITNVYWSNMYAGVDISLQHAFQGLQFSQGQISKLKNCIDTGTKPCNITVSTTNQR